MTDEETRRFNELMYATGIVRVDIIDGTKRLIHDIEERHLAGVDLPDVPQNGGKKAPPPLEQVAVAGKTTSSPPPSKR